MERDFLGFIKGNKVFMIKKIQFIPFSPMKYHALEDKQKEREIAYLDMINKIITQEKSFLYSPTRDMTINTQRIQEMKQKNIGGHYWTRVRYTKKVQTISKRCFI